MGTERDLVRSYGQPLGLASLPLMFTLTYNAPTTGETRSRSNMYNDV